MRQRRTTGGGCRSTGRVTAKLLLSFLAATTITSTTASWAQGWLGGIDQVPIISGSAYEPSNAPSQTSRDHEFTLRHIFHHGVYEYPNLHRRLDIPPESTVWTSAEGQDGRVQAGPLRARSRPVSIQRLSDRRMPVLQDLISTARLTGIPPIIAPSAWTLDEVPGPNVTDKDTIINLAMMAANAYDQDEGTGEWEDVNAGFNYSDSFGWEGDGLRGHIFADQGNQTVVVALKGTTPAVFDGAGSTTKDKINDNLFFSCCCAQGGHYLWKQVCDCSSSTFTCNQTCLIKALTKENRYYQAATELYGNVTELYPNANVWFAGHSLGGSVSSMLGLTFGLPVTTFEAPGEALAAARLGLPVPPGIDPSAPQTRSNTGAYHFGHTADPIFMGTCNSATSGCTLGGYAMETQCHTGNVCIYDTVKDKNWRVSISWHKIRSVISDVYRAYDAIPECIQDTECVDCYNWKYYESNGSDPTTTGSVSLSTTTTTPTRTSTCKTPGWWGCLDPTSTTTTPVSTVFSTVTATTVTCIRYGWFGGCLDSSTTTITSTITSTTAVPAKTTDGATATSDRGGSSTTATCTHWGWFGRCLDPQPKRYGYLATPRATARATG
ncbi:MAG: hypothetical protein Q9219_000596 [cf. Caloplaca sp. 3 TL-2023]